MTAGRWRGAAHALLLGGVTVSALGQTAPACLTQARMTPELRSSLGTAALELARAIGSNDAAGVKARALPEMATNFDATAFLIRNVAARVAGDQPRVTQIYVLDASARTAGDTGDAEFACALSGSASETDFSISSLPPGRYGFAMAEETGAHPYLLSFLLRADGPGAATPALTGVGWKLAGFYPRSREMGGHDGLWFWNQARADVKNGHNWAAWVRFGAAEELLRPAPIATSSHLDRLELERRTAAPPELANGISEAAPLVLKAANGTELRFTGIAADASEDERKLRLTLRFKVDGQPDAAAARARNLLAARTLLGAHPELADGFDDVLIIAEAPGNNPSVTTIPAAELAGSR